MQYRFAVNFGTVSTMIQGECGNCHQVSEWMCRDTRCVNSSLLCNGVKDCRSVYHIIVSQEMETGNWRNFVICSVLRTAWSFFWNHADPLTSLDHYWIITSSWPSVKSCETGYFGRIRILAKLGLPLFNGIKSRSKIPDLDSKILVRSHSVLGLNHVFFFFRGSGPDYI